MENKKFPNHSVFNQEKVPSWDEELEFTSQLLASYQEFSREFNYRVESLCEILLAENLFNETMPVRATYGEYAYHKDGFWEDWKSSAITEIDGPNDSGTITCTLSRYLGCGDYDTRDVTFSSSLLFGPIQPALSALRKKRDSFYKKCVLDIAQEKKLSRQKDLAYKKQLLAQLQKELGPVA